MMGQEEKEELTTGCGNMISLVTDERCLNSVLESDAWWDQEQVGTVWEGIETICIPFVGIPAVKWSRKMLEGWEGI